MQIYIDNEVPWAGGLGEWDAGVLTSGAASIVRSTAAAFPDRGGFGLRITAAAGNPVHIRKNNTIPALPPGGAVWVGLWLRVNQTGPNYTYFLNLCGYAVRLGLKPTLFGVVINDSGGPHFTSDAPAAPNSWRYVVLKVTRASAPGATDGKLEVWVDGRTLTPVAGYANFNKLAGGGELDLGNFTPPVSGFVIDADEVKISTDGYPAPFVPTPADELPSPTRTVVLYRSASAESRSFADYCAARLGIPQANLVALDTAGAGETLSDYASFQSQFETPIASYFAIHPAVGANCTCFLIGYGLPGGFMASGVLHSAASRLSNFGTAFTPGGVANPLYRPGAPARLTRTLLAGKYMAGRIDAPSLATAEALVEHSLAVAALAALPGNDALFCDDALYRDSEIAQRLRIATAALPAGTTPYTQDALVSRSTVAALPTFAAPAGARAAFVDGYASSAVTLRAATSACSAALFNGLYAAALGVSAASDGFDAASFFDMLRMGGTFAEAALVATPKLDYTACPAGNPLMTVAFGQAGYNIYGGSGDSAACVDWASPLGHTRPGQAQVKINQPLQSVQSYVFAARAISAEGLEESGTQAVVRVEVDAQGQLLAPAIAPAQDLSAKSLSDGSVLLVFSCYPTALLAGAAGFDILSDHGSGQLDLVTPVAQVTPRGGQVEFQVRLDRPAGPVLLAVRPTLAGRQGPTCEPLRFEPAAAPPPAQYMEVNV